MVRRRKKRGRKKRTGKQLIAAFSNFESSFFFFFFEFSKHILRRIDNAFSTAFPLRNFVFKLNNGMANV
jgi:hypothetical protein